MIWDKPYVAYLLCKTNYMYNYIYIHMSTSCEVDVCAACKLCVYIYTHVCVCLCVCRVCSETHYIVHWFGTFPYVSILACRQRRDAFLHPSWAQKKSTHFFQYRTRYYMNYRSGFTMLSYCLIYLNKIGDVQKTILCSWHDASFIPPRKPQYISIQEAHVKSPLRIKSFPRKLNNMKMRYSKFIQ